MIELTGSVDVGKPAGEVFAYLSEPKNSLEWESALIDVELTSDGPVDLGSKGRRVEKYVGTDESTWEITEYAQDKTIAMTFESGKFAGQGRWDLEPVDGGTRLAYGFKAKPHNFIWNLVVPLMMPMMRGRVKKDYLKLKQILESRG